jgi:hypothetical protein
MPPASPERQSMKTNDAHMHSTALTSQVPVMRITCQDKTCWSSTALTVTHRFCNSGNDISRARRFNRLEGRRSAPFVTADDASVYATSPCCARMCQ